jgi:hypothetical protein
VVQHSGFGDKPGFEKGLESAAVDTAAKQQAIERAGGILFDTYTDAELFCEREMYPDAVPGLYPQALGSFSEMTVTTLGDFQPDAEVFIAHSPEDWIAVKVVGAENEDGQVPLEVTWPAGIPGYELGQRITASAGTPAREQLTARTVGAQARQAQ